MDLWLILVVAGFVLVIVELLSGTFYLLAIAAGAFAAAGVAALGGNVLFQALAGSVIALAGSIYVHHWHGAHRNADVGQGNLLDRGQAVVLESWVDEVAGLARVKYRGTSWDARIVGATVKPAPGSRLYIDAQEGNTLVVGATPPAR